MDQWIDPPHQPADYYRQKAAKARQAAEGVTTQAVKARLLDRALEYDRLADEAERAAGDASG
jgi:hypothetical protein